MKNKFLDITVITYVLVSLLIIFQAIEFIKVFGLLLVFIILLPLILLFILKKISNKYNWKNITTNIITSIIIVSSLFHFLFIEILFFVLKSDFIFPFSLGPKLPKISEYADEIDTLKRKHGFYDMRHFPDKLPDDVTNYYFQIEDAFDGLNTDYLKFDTNKTYIDGLLKKYNKECEVFSTYENLYKKGTSLQINELDSEDNVCLLHKKNDKEVYTYGFAIKKNKKSVIFFYADF